jgi:hypothetical protein
VVISDSLALGQWPQSPIGPPDIARLNTRQHRQESQAAAASTVIDATIACHSI